MERVISQTWEGDVVGFGNVEFEMPTRYWCTDSWEAEESRLS